MRSEQAPPPDQGAEFNSGINMLPGLMPDDYQPLTGASDYRPPSFTPSPSAVPIPRATPVEQQQDPWRTNAGSYRTNYPAPGTPISYPAPGTPFYGAPIDSGQSFFSKLFETLTGGIAGAAGGLGDIFKHFGDHAPQQQGAPTGPRLSGGASRAAFGQTIFQAHNPGSMIGPTSGLVSNPFINNGMPLGGRQPLGGAPSAGAQAFSNVVKSRNIV